MLLSQEGRLPFGELACHRAEAYRKDQDRTLEDILVEGGSSENGQAVEAYADDQHTDKGAENVEFSILQCG